MEKIPKKAKKEGPDLESRLYGVEDMPSADETKLYMAKGGDEVKGLMNKVKGYWNDIKPRDIKDLVGYTVMPVPYYM